MGGAGFRRPGRLLEGLSVSRRPGYMDRQQRALSVRTDGSILVNSGPGFMTDFKPFGAQPIRWGDYPSANPPSWWLGRDTFDGRPIGPNGPWLDSSESALPAVTRCTEIITNTIVRTPWRYFLSSSGEFLDRPLWVDDPMLIGRAPGPIGPTVPAGLRLDGHSFFATFLTHALWWGLGAFVCVEASDGTPLPGTLRILNPYMLGIGEDGRWVINPRDDGAVVTDWDGRFSVGGQSWRLVTLRGLGPNDSQAPEGVLTRHYATLKIGAAVSEYVAGTFTSGIPAGYLKVGTPNMTSDGAAALKADWMRAHGGSKRSIAVLSSTVDFEPISLSPVDSEVAQVAHHLRTEVAHAFGLSAIWLDEGASGLTYQNNSDRRRDLVDISLAGWSERLMAVLTSLLPFGQRVEVNWAAFTTPSIEAHVPALVAAVQVGLMTNLEARQVLGLARTTGPDPDWRDISPAGGEPPPPPPRQLVPVPEEVPDEQAG